MSTHEHTDSQPPGLVFTAAVRALIREEVMRLHINPPRERDRKYLTVKEAADEIGVSEEWIRTRLKRRDNPIPHLSDGVIRIERGALLDWVDAATEQGKPKVLRGRERIGLTRLDAK